MLTARTVTAQRTLIGGRRAGLSRVGKVGGSEQRLSILGLFVANNLVWTHVPGCQP